MNRLAALRGCFEGIVPAAIVTCSADGVPNVTYLSHVEYIDAEHVALTFQFFNKTRANILANPIALLGVVHPTTAAQYRLRIRYLRTETSGSLFERMRARLASIASYTGMSDVFRLQGADVYRVEDIEHVSGPATSPAHAMNTLGAVRTISERLATATDLAVLFQAFLDGVAEHLGITHASILFVDRERQRLYTVASHGYGPSGIGSEIPLGAGAIGIAAAHGTPIRLGHVSAEYSYGSAIRDRFAAEDTTLETAIALPGLATSQSQIAVPMELAGVTIGVVFAESEQLGRFTFADEDALVILARQLAAMSRALDDDAAALAVVPTTPAPPATQRRSLRHYRADDSVFVDGEYLIKGVAGAILWKLVREHRDGRSQFTNKELRLDRTLGLPEIGDNLEARLVLLERRLRERDAGILIEKTGRGRFRLVVSVALDLVDES